MFRFRPASARSLTALVFFTAPVFIANLAFVQAQPIADCRGHIPGAMPQVYLNDLVFSSSALEADPQLERFAERLSFKLESRFRGLAAELSPIALRFAHCPGRKPTVAAFSASLIESLDDDKVILEVMGQLDARVSGGAISDRSASICFVLVPVWADDRSLGNAAIHYVTYPKGTATSGELINLLERAVELDAFVEVGVGFHLLRDDHYDAAYAHLQKARGLLRSCPEPPQGLIEYVEKKMRETIAEARSKSTYQGALRDLVDG